MLYLTTHNWNQHSPFKCESPTSYTCIVVITNETHFLTTPSCRLSVQGWDIEIHFRSSTKPDQSSDTVSWGVKGCGNKQRAKYFKTTRYPDTNSLPNTLRGLWVTFLICPTLSSFIIDVWLNHSHLNSIVISLHSIFSPNFG